LFDAFARNVEHCTMPQIQAKGGNRFRKTAKTLPQLYFLSPDVVAEEQRRFFIPFARSKV
jgi:hypothetical protein